MSTPIKPAKPKWRSEPIKPVKPKGKRQKEWRGERLYLVTYDDEGNQVDAVLLTGMGGW